MNRLAKTILLTATAAALTLSAIGEASAGDRYWRHGHDHGNDALVGGAVGLATGLIVGSAIANANNGPVYEERRYIDPPVYEPEYAPPPVYRAPRAVYSEPVYSEPVYGRPVYGRSAGAMEPWSAQWQRYCSYRYRSFDPQSGTYVGNDGREHFCVAS